MRETIKQRVYPYNIWFGIDKWYNSFLIGWLTVLGERLNNYYFINRKKGLLESDY